MFEIRREATGLVVMTGRFDAAQVDRARDVLDTIEDSCTLDFRDLSYISSVGLGVLATTLKRLARGGHTIRIVNLNTHLRNLFHITGFDTLFEIE